MTLCVKPQQLDAMREHGRLAYPHECCGLMLGLVDGSEKVVKALRRTENAREDASRNRYLIDPSEMLQAEREARARGWDILGVYHSHPDHPARPSEFDREHALPWYSYVIVSVEDGDAKDLTCWTLREDRSVFDPEQMTQLP